MNLPLLTRRVPYVPQMELAECGAACLAMILHYWGAAIPLATLRVACGVSRDGASAGGILRAAKSYGLVAKALRLDAAVLNRLALPAIIHWHGNHFVVLERIGRRRATIIDPACGHRVVAQSELAGAFSGVAFVFSAGPGFERVARRDGGLRRYLGLLAGSRSVVALVIAAALLLELVTMVYPAADQVMVDHVAGPARRSWLLPLMAVLALTKLTALALGWIKERLVQNITYSLDLGLVTGFVDHLVRLSLQFLGQRTTGDLMQRVQANDVLKDLATSTISALLDGFLVLGYSALMVAYDPSLAAIAIALNLARLLVVIAGSSRMQQLSASQLALGGRERAAAIEGLSAPEAIQAFRAESLVVENFTDAMTRRLNATLRLRRFTSSVSHLAMTFDALAVSALLWFGGNAVLDERLSLGALIGFLAMRLLLTKPLESLVAAISQLTHARGIVARMDDVWQTPTERDGTLDPGGLLGALRLEQACFAHAPSSPLLCDHVDLAIAPGEVIGIAGRSGVGKTTLGHLLLGLHEPTSGRVLIDGRPLRDFARARLRRQVGIVLQEPGFLSGTVRENLCLCHPNTSLERLRWACAVACIDDVIMALPKGYDTRLGSQGSQLSGGQRQRLALARALVGGPRILLLDEATSSLDAATEARVHSNLRRLGCTRIVIAHRLGTLRDADRILVLERGRIVQQGRYDALAQSDGPFRNLLQGKVAA